MEGLRQQYHFNSNDNGGMDAWDVHRLIDLTAGFPVDQVPIPEAELDSVYWFDAGMNKPTVRAVVKHATLIEEASLEYPIIMGADGRIMDGMHRIAKALMAGHSTIAAVKFETDPEPDYRNCKPEDLPY